MRHMGPSAGAAKSSIVRQRTVCDFGVKSRLGRCKADVATAQAELAPLLLAGRAWSEVFARSMSRPRGGNAIWRKPQR